MTSEIDNSKIDNSKITTGNSNNNNNNNTTNKTTLLFSSMGDRPDVLSTWLGCNQDYILFIVTYTKNLSPEMIRLLDRVEHHYNHPGSKFQNLAYYYPKIKDIYFSGNEAIKDIIVIDDDLKLSVANINQWINTHRKYKLWISQPSFLSGSGLQVSWKITKKQPDKLLHFSTFIEMSAPMFSVEALKQWMPDYIPFANKLAGWGVDLFYMLTLYPFHSRVFAVLDQVSVENPIRQKVVKKVKMGSKVIKIAKKHTTGMNTLISKGERKLQWEKIRHLQGWTEQSYPINQSGYIDLEGEYCYHKKKFFEHAKLKTSQYGNYLDLLS